MIKLGDKVKRVHLPFHCCSVYRKCFRSLLDDSDWMKGIHYGCVDPCQKLLISVQIDNDLCSTSSVPEFPKQTAISAIAHGIVFIRTPWCGNAFIILIQ